MFLLRQFHWPRPDSRETCFLLSDLKRGTRANTPLLAIEFQTSPQPDSCNFLQSRIRPQGPECCAGIQPLCRGLIRRCAMSSNNRSGLPAEFKRLAWSNLAAQSAEQIGLAAAPIVAVLMLGAQEAASGALQTAQTLPFLLFALPAGVLVD